MSNYDELYHHGTKGQKWGQRLYQNPDGTYTTLGKLRRRKELIQKEQAKAKKQRDAKALKQKKVLRAHDLDKVSTEELKNRTARLNAEKNYLQAKSDVAKLNPRIKSRGERFSEYIRNDLIGDIILGAAKDAGKAWLTQQFKDSLGVREEGSGKKKKK